MAKKSTEYDISKSGPRSYRDLQRMNSELASLSSLPSYTPRLKSNSDYIYEGEEKSPLLLLGNGDYWGNSIYDENTATIEQFEDLNEVRAENQPWYAKLGAGVAKGLGNAATSFLSGTVGIAYGIGSAANGGSFWDNDFNKAMDDVNQAMEEWLPNYYTRDEIENPLAWRNIFSANTLGDKLIKNLGFSVGMLYGGSVVTGLLKATRLPRLLTKLTGSAKASRAVTSLVASTTAAAGEANIEAYRGAAELVKAQTAMAEMEYDDAVRALMDVYTPAIQAGDLQAIAELNTRISELEALKNAKIQTIKDNGRKAGDTIWLGNMAVLMPSNLIQFGKVFSRGLSSMRGSVKLTGSLGDLKGATGKGALAWGLSKGAITEGMEEISQGAITRGTANYYEKQLDPQAEEETKSIMQEITGSLIESFATDEGKEEFLLGAVTGALGIPMIGRRRSGKIGPKLEGGIFSEIADYKRQKATEDFMALQLNARANDPKFKAYYEGLIRHKSYQSDLELFHEANMEDEYKDTEHSLLISDIIMFDSVGRLGDLEATVKYQSENLTDDELDNIIKTTSRIDESTGEVLGGPFVEKNDDGVLTPLTATEQGKLDMREAIELNAKTILRTIEQYRNIATNIEAETDGSLSDNLLKELTFMAAKIADYKSRLRDSISELEEMLQDNPELAGEGTAIRELLDRSPVNLFSSFVPINKKVLALKLLLKDEDLANRLSEEKDETFFGPYTYIQSIVNLQKHKELYESKFEEYKNNPERQLIDHKKAEDKAQKKKELKKKKEVVKDIKDQTVGELANDESLLDDADVILDDDVEVVGSSDIMGELSDETNATKSKIKQAKTLKKLTDTMIDRIQKSVLSGLDPIVAGILTKIFSNASNNVQEDVKEVLDREALAYLDNQVIIDTLMEDPNFQQESEEGKLNIFAETLLRVLQSLDELVGILNEAYNKKINTPEEPAVERLGDEDPTDDHPSKLEVEGTTYTITNNTTEYTASDGETRLIPKDADLMTLPLKYLAELWESRFDERSIKDDIEDIIGFRMINEKDGLGLALVKLKDGTTTEASYILTRKNTSITTAPTELPSYEGTHPSETENSYFVDQLKPSTPRLPIRSPFGDMTPWATILYRLKNAVEKKQSGLELTEEESKYYEFYKDEIEDPNSIMNKYNMLTESYIKRAAAIHEYLTKVGAFDAVDSNQVLKGDTIHLVVDKELSDRVERPVVLLAKISDSGLVTIVGDLLKNTSNASLVTKIENLYQKFISENPDASRFISNYSTKVVGNFVGRIPFSPKEDAKPLNQIFGKKGSKRSFTIGIVKDNSGYILAEGTDIKTSEIRRMKSSKPGQPVILIETSDTKSGRHYVPVPFSMSTYSSDNANSTLGKAVEDSIDELVKVVNQDVMTDSQMIAVKNEICKVLALDTKDSSIFITSDASTVKIDLKINGERTYIKVQKGLNLKDELLTKMQEANIPFVINLKSINDKTEDGDDYNSIIGEIAQVNLHPGSNHTLSDFFTMEKIPLEGSKGRTNNSGALVANTIDYVSKGNHLMSVNTDTWEITIDNDRTLNDPQHTDPTANIYRAMAYGLKNNLPLDAPYDTIWGRFDPVNRLFVVQQKGQSAIDIRWKRFLEAVESKDPTKILTAISIIKQTYAIIERKNQENPNDPRALFTEEQLNLANQAEHQLYEQGYRIITEVGDLYTSGVQCEAEFKTDEQTPVGYPIITQVKKPMITHNGVMVLSAEITVSQSPYTSILHKLISTNEYQYEQATITEHSFPVLNYISDSSTVLGVSIDDKYYRVLFYAPLVDSMEELNALKSALQDQIIRAILSRVNAEHGTVGNPVVESLVRKYLMNIANGTLLENSEEAVSEGIASEEVVSEETVDTEKETNLRKKLARTPTLLKIYDSLDNKQKNRVLSLGSKAKGTLQQLLSFYDASEEKFTDELQVDGILYPTKYRASLKSERPSKESQVKREARWFKRILPNLSQQECLVIVNNMLDIKNSNHKAWGKFTEGVILVFKNAAKGTIYHEAFHAVVSMLLSTEEKNRMMSEAAKQYPDLANDLVALEEALAEDFRRYTLKQQIPFIGPIVKLFRKVYLSSRRLRNKSMYLDNIYYRINNGDYGKRNIVSNALGIIRNNAVLEYKDLLRELQLAESEKGKIKKLWGFVKSQIAKKGTELNKLSSTKYKSYGEAAARIPANLADVLGVLYYRGNFYIGAKNEMDLYETLDKVQRIINTIREAVYTSETVLEERISDEALEELNTRYRVANVTNISEENVNNELIEDVQAFLRHFNITLKEVDDYLELEPLFDALNRIIYYKSSKDLTESTGQAIAFMMQHDPVVNSIVWKKSPIYKALFKFAGLFKNKLKYRAFLYRKLPSKSMVLKGLGHNISKELLKIYKGKGFVDTNEDTSTIILNFFKNWASRSMGVYDLINKYSRNAANSVRIGDYTVIDSITKKPGTGEETSRVHIDLALLENPYEEDIIYKLGLKGYALAGSAALAVQGTVFRPSENPLHDIDFLAQGKSVLDIEEAVNFISPYNKFIRMINNDSGPTYTYLVLDRPFIIERPVKGTAAYVLLDPVTREQYGSYTGSELILNGNTKGKFLDFFTGEKRYLHLSTTINGKNYLIGNENYAMEAKVDWQRNKDIWDYNRYLPNELYQLLLAELELSDLQLQSRIEESNIIWGHPAIGKTTYLETHDDIIEWDKEVNPKRNRFIQEQIDPNNELDEYTFNKKRQEYMANFAAHPEYEQFLRNEWQRLKVKAKRQNKKIFASPLPLLKMFPLDFDLVINLYNREFLRNNTNRGGKLFSTMDWKYAINEVLATLPRDKVVNTGKYMSELAEGVNMSPIELHHNNKFLYDNLSLSYLEYLKEKGITKEEFDSWPAREREIALHCKQ